MANNYFTPDKKQACPCYIHTFETGDYTLFSYVKRPTEPRYLDAYEDEKQGMIGNCHNLEYHGTDLQTWNAESAWRFVEEYSIPDNTPKLTLQIHTDGFQPGPKNETIFLAPNFVYPSNTGIGGTWNLTLETLEAVRQGALGQDGHQLEIAVYELTEGQALPDSTSPKTVVKTAAEVKTLIDAAMTAQHGVNYAALANPSFSTGDKLVNISFGLGGVGLVAGKVYAIGLTNTSLIPNNQSKVILKIHNLRIEPPKENRLPLRFPQIEFDAEKDDRRGTGKLIFHNSAGLSAADCVWCWGGQDYKVQSDPSLEDISAGYYFLKAVNTADGYTFPIKRYSVKRGFQSTNSVDLPNFFKTELSIKEVAEENFPSTTGYRAAARQARMNTTLDSWDIQMYNVDWYMWFTGIYPDAWYEDDSAYGNVNPDVYLSGTVWGHGLFNQGMICQHNSLFNKFYKEISTGIAENCDTTKNRLMTMIILHYIFGDTAGLSTTGTFAGFSEQLGGTNSGYDSSISSSEEVMGWDITAATQDGPKGFQKCHTGIYSFAPVNGVPTSSNAWAWQVWKKFEELADTQACKECESPYDGVPKPEEAKSRAWIARGRKIWNNGLRGEYTTKGECCEGEEEYVYPAFVLHRDKIWQSTRPGADTTTEPGSQAGARHWKEHTGKIDGALTSKKYLEYLEKPYIFAVEANELSQYNKGQSKVVRGTRSKNIQLENLNNVQPQTVSKRKIKKRI